MHYRLLVTIPKDGIETSEEARQSVSEYLTNEGFCDQDKRFHKAPADWFVIGGRWSGCLNVNIEKFFEASKKFQVNEWGLTDKDIKQNTTELQKLWRDLGGKGLHPYERDGYRHNGSDDDAILLDTVAYDTFLKGYEGVKVEKIGDREYETKNGEYGEYWLDAHKWHLGWIDTEHEALSSALVGTRWLVVVDYHS